MANPEIEVRPATANDLAALNDIYNQYVAEAHYTFDVEPMTIEARRE
jgi:L-amino acid N-acyltransferase YncA